MEITHARLVLCFRDENGKRIKREQNGKSQWQAAHAFFDDQKVSFDDSTDWGLIQSRKQCTTRKEEKTFKWHNYQYAKETGRINMEVFA